MDVAFSSDSSSNSNIITWPHLYHYNHNFEKVARTIISHRDGNFIDKERHQDAAAGTRQDHRDELVRERRSRGRRREDFAAMQVGVPQLTRGEISSPLS